MRIQGLINYKSKNHNSLHSNSTRFLKKNTLSNTQPQHHKYTGVVSADLAYASMFDNKIAKELKMMGLI